MVEQSPKILASEENATTTTSYRRAWIRSAKAASLRSSDNENLNHTKRHVKQKKKKKKEEGEEGMWSVWWMFCLPPTVNNKLNPTNGSAADVK